jgi:four helix bundle protein
MHSGTQNIQIRTKNFSLQIIRLYPHLSNEPAAQIIGNQLLRSATSVGAHVREGKHSRSAAEMFSKISVGLQEMEESRYWLELLEEGGFARVGMKELIREADELIAILFTSTRTLKQSLR